MFGSVRDTNIAFLRILTKATTTVRQIPIRNIDRSGLRSGDGSADPLLALAANPLTNPPPEIVEQGNAAILEYFRTGKKDN